MIQSLLTQAEYDKYSKFRKTYNPKFRRYTTPFRVEVGTGGERRVCGPPPCYVMGDSLSASEISVFNKLIDAALRSAGLIK